jgi:hypothetical protein
MEPAMTHKSVVGGVLSVLVAAVALGGCSSVADLPYPKLSEIVPAEDPSLSPEEKAAMIEDLERDRNTHEDAASQDIESR